MEKKIKLDASKMMDILVGMIKTSWENEQIMLTALRDLSTLFEGMNLTVEEYTEFTSISDTLLEMKEVNWDDFYAELKIQQTKAKNTELDKLINEIGCNYGE